jgi:tetratricopeptide (TPR) repeat protein
MAEEQSQRGFWTRMRSKLGGLAKDGQDVQSSFALPATAAELFAEMTTIKARFEAGEHGLLRGRLHELTSSPFVNADVWTHLGVAYVLSGNYVDAVEPLECALQADPRHTVALRFLTAAHAMIGNLTEAFETGLECLRLHPSDHETITTVGIVLFRLGKLDEASRYLERAIQANPNALNALCNLAMMSERGLARSDTDPKLSPRAVQILQRTRKRYIAQFESGTLPINAIPDLIALLHGDKEHFPMLCRVVDQYPMPADANEDTARRYLLVHKRRGDDTHAVLAAEQYARGRPKAKGPRRTLANMMLAAGAGDWAQNWKTLRECHDEDDTNFVQVVPEWDGSALRGRTLFVYQDQGYGDLLIGLRLIQELVKRHIRYVLWVQPSIAALARTVVGCEAVQSQPVCPDPREHGCQLMIPLFGLISALGLGPSNISRPAFVQADQALVQAWQERLVPLSGCRIGLALMGNPKRHDDWVRSVPPEIAKPLRTIGERVSWVNLSVDRRPDLRTLVSELRIADYTDSMSDFAQTAALIAALDAVVTIDCVIAHLAAALGKPTWVMVPTQLDWRWRMGNVLSPWWPQVTALQAKSAGDWSDTMTQLTAEIETFLRR